MRNVTIRGDAKCPSICRVKNTFEHPDFSNGLYGGVGFDYLLLQLVSTSNTSSYFSIM